MNDTIRVGRIAGVEVGLNWSALLLVALVTWSYARQVSVLIALSAAVLLLVSVLLHELGHTTQARKEGMRIDGITLWMFGGVARFRGNFPSAGAEFRIAIAGPLVSLGLAIAFAGALFVPGLPGDLGTLTALLAYVNAALFVFNLLPALPLDGGRMLRAVLWHRSGDYAKGTLIAARIARGLAYVLIAGGAALALFVSLLSGLWLAFIGWFLLGAARAEHHSVATHNAFGNLKVSDAMVAPPPSVGPELTVAQLSDRLAFQPPSASYPVVNADRLVGVVMARDIAAVPGDARATTTLNQLMRSADATPSVSPEDLLVDAATYLGGGLDSLPVLVDGRLVGLVTIAGLSRALGRTQGLRPATES